MTTTDGRRLYAFGDVHGCLGALTHMIALAREDLVHTPHPRPVFVFVGDYVDRGPDSRGVLEALIGLEQADINTVFLLGNHDQMMLDYLTDPRAALTDKYHWLHSRLGGDTTLASYGVPDADPHDPDKTQAAFRAAVPQAHLDFLARAQLFFEAGSYAFVHAGIRPGVPLAMQSKQDLIWIRDPFLYETAPHDHIVVHGHTPVDQVEHHGNRIAIDTGAVFGGHLTCLVLEDDQVWDLRTTGRIPVRPTRRG